ncbi:sugar transferase [Muriicola marianensis]|uniref:Sugar transferase n=1 Tax=Muriicola marianensis TaxID=1324801 RepID=A0ABQ1QQK9_9FLAO|nr:sugar transferase [Muriicola marianensis]GGD41081.1 sugar transferase [Muriicola marianensis]
MYRTFFKRSLDLVFSLSLLVVLFPVILIISVILLVTTGDSPFFKQVRPGKDEALFSIFKFKTMNDDRDRDGNLLPDRDRLTVLGSFLRRSSLDEIPQLFNVLIGDMSFVGPRPLLLAYLPYYTEEERKRHQIRPGITGLAQVSGRNHLGWDERLAIDVKYFDNMSFWLDAKIILLTIGKVLGSKDIVVDGSSQVRLDDERRLTLVPEKKSDEYFSGSYLKVV